MRSERREFDRCVMKPRVCGASTTEYDKSSGTYVKPLRTAAGCHYT